MHFIFSMVSLKTKFLIWMKNNLFLFFFGVIAKKPLFVFKTKFKKEKKRANFCPI